MTIHIIGSGETGSKWSGIGPSIGCNDSFKWGHPIDFLLLLNRPSQFQESRREVILSTKPKKVYTNMPYVWEKYFKDVHELSPLRRWSSGSPVKKGIYYHSSTSPFVGLSMAYNFGFNNVVMWGVDLITHQKYGRGQDGHIREMLKFNSFIKAIQAQGMKVYIGSKGTAFDSILPVWDKQLING
jgi:hypothetical protein